MNKTLKLALATVPFLLSVACTDPNKLPAEGAIKAAEAAANALTAEVAKYAPEQVKAFKDQLAAAKAAVEKQDWKTARATAEALAPKAVEIVAAANAKKAEATKAATAAVAKLAEEVAAIQARLADLAKAKKLPKGITKETVAKAKEAVAELEAGAAKVKEEVMKDLDAAGAKAKELGAKAAEVAASLQAK
jgi:hypothetical protein